YPSCTGSGRGILEMATLESQQFQSEDRPLQGPRAPSGAPLNPNAARKRTEIPLKRPSFVMLCTTRSIIDSFHFRFWFTRRRGCNSAQCSDECRECQYVPPAPLLHSDWTRDGIFSKVYVQCTY